MLVPRHVSTRTAVGAYLPYHPWHHDSTTSTESCHLSPCGRIDGCRACSAAHVAALIAIPIDGRAAQPVRPCSTLAARAAAARGLGGSGWRAGWAACGWGRVLDGCGALVQPRDRQGPSAAKGPSRHGRWSAAPAARAGRLESMLQQHALVGWNQCSSSTRPAAGTGDQQQARLEQRDTGLVAGADVWPYGVA